MTSKGPVSLDNRIYRLCVVKTSKSYTSVTKIMQLPLAMIQRPTLSCPFLEDLLNIINYYRTESDELNVVYFIFSCCF